MIALFATWMTAAAASAADTSVVIRVNQVGYLPDAPKVAVVCALTTPAPGRFAQFTVLDERGRTRVRAGASARERRVRSVRRDMAARLQRAAPRGTLRRRIGRHSIARRSASAQTCTRAARTRSSTTCAQQRSAFNPFFRDSVHRLDGNRHRRSGARRQVHAGERRMGGREPTTCSTSRRPRRRRTTCCWRIAIIPRRSATRFTANGSRARIEFPTCSMRRGTESSGSSRMYPERHGAVQPARRRSRPHLPRSADD